MSESIDTKEKIVYDNVEESGFDSSDVDAAMALADASKEISYTKEEEDKLMRKINWYLFPVLLLVYGLQFMDKTSTASASIMGLRKDLKMVGQDFSWTGSSFYLGYLVFELPGSYILQKLPLAKTTAFFVIVWGMILCLHSAPSVNFKSFLALRVLLGMFESTITPAFTILTSQWWRADEQFLRTTIWFVGAGGGSMVANGIAYGLYVHRHSYDLAPWRILFVVIGCMTIFAGFCVLFHIPDDPSKAWFLNEREKLILVNRIRSNQQGFGNKKIKVHQIKEALLDMRTWIMFVYVFAAQIPNGGIQNFSFILLNLDFKYTVTKSTLMGLPNGAIEIVGCPLFAYICYKAHQKGIPIIKDRITWAIIAMVIQIIGTAMLAFAGGHAGLAGIFLYALAPVAFTCALSLISSNVAGTTKKYTVNAIMLIGYSVGNILGPQTFRAKEAPNYHSAKISMMACAAVSVVALLVLYFVNVRENNRRNKLAEEGKIAVVENIEFADLTDFENLNFRYSL